MIQIKNIIKNYLSGDSQVNALKEVSVNFRNNEFVSILGPSGCGKTTLLNIIGGLDKYTAGDIIINGVSTKLYKDRDWDAYRNHYIGFIFQSYNLINHLNILENVELALSIAGISKNEKRKKAMKALKEVGLADQMKKKPNQLSGGQMQRVAIARAIVNEPKIILADEPTGALDSETSVQVMEILKKISNKYLIIMVTHNEDLAHAYSTRIIKVLDGKVTDDTRPYNPSEDEIQEDKRYLDKINNKSKQKLKSSMNYLTAFALSLKNLLSKKGKTIIESLAGSIGIIGIALVLAVSTGMTNYINTIQSDALGNYPITVSAISIDMSKFSSSPQKENTENIEEDILVPYNPLSQFITYGHYNNLSGEFLNQVKEFEENNADNLNLVDYNYYTPVKMLVKNNDEVKFIKRNNCTSIMSGESSSPIFPMINNLDFLMNHYELIYGHMPMINSGDEYSKEMLLIVGEGNKLSTNILEGLGITPTTTEIPGEYNNISFETICSLEYKLLFNDDYYTPNNDNFDQITSFNNLDINNQTELNNAYNASDVSLRISGVIRLKENATALIVSNGLAYMPSLETYYAQDCNNSLIARKQTASKSNYTFFDNYVLDVSEMKGILPVDGFANVNEINAFLNLQYGYTLSKDDAFEVAMQQIGISSIPISIKFYPKNFDAKDKIINMIDDFNTTKSSDSQKIICSDTTAFLTNTLGQMINIVSYVLIAFAGISLIVSSVMIGIITYTSVIERTKEIGVLRSIGARKKDISRIFNSETILIGLFAGLLGIGISWILTFPISAIIINLSGGMINTCMAILKPLDALVLVLISVILTFIAGTIPARIASKKDPVICLRTE